MNYITKSGIYEDEAIIHLDVRSKATLISYIGCILTILLLDNTLELRISEETQGSNHQNKQLRTQK